MTLLFLPEPAPGSGSLISKAASIECNCFTVKKIPLFNEDSAKGWGSLTTWIAKGTWPMLGWMHAGGSTLVGTHRYGQCSPTV